MREEDPWWIKRNPHPGTIELRDKKRRPIRINTRVAVVIDHELLTDISRMDKLVEAMHEAEDVLNERMRETFGADGSMLFDPVRPNSLLSDTVDGIAHRVINGTNFVVRQVKKG